MKVIKTVIQYIITTLVSISIILFLGIQLISSTILNETYILSKLEETGYYDKIYEDVKSNFEKYIAQSGLEESVLKNIITKEKIKEDTQLIINNLYDGLGQTVDTQKIRDNMNQNIEKTLEYSKLNATQKKAIDTFIDEICNEYTTTISHYEYEKQINEIYKKGMKYINVTKKVILVIIAIGMISLLVINRKRIYKAFSLWGVAVTINGGFFIILYTFINTKIKIQTILILNEAISNTLKNMITDVLHTMNVYAYFMLGIGMMLIIGSNLIHNKLKYGKQTYEKEN